MINKRMQLFGAWCSLVYLVLLGIGFWFFPNFIPPHEPSWSPEEITAIIQNNTNGIRIGMVINMFGAMLVMPFFISIAMELKEIEKGAGMLTMWQVMGGLSTAILTFYPAMWWLIASFRPETRDPQIIQFLNDTAWLQFVGGVTIFLPSMITVAIGSFMDTREQPAFPRWLGYVTIWGIILFLPSQLIFFFHEGPFAWNGILAFWMPTAVLMGWWLLMGWMVRKSALRLPD